MSEYFGMKKKVELFSKDRFLNNGLKIKKSEPHLVFGFYQKVNPSNPPCFPIPMKIFREEEIFDYAVKEFWKSHSSSFRTYSFLFNVVLIEQV